MKYKVGHKHKNLEIIGTIIISKKNYYICKCICGNTLNKRSYTLNEKTREYCDKCYPKRNGNNNKMYVTSKFSIYKSGAFARNYEFKLTIHQFNDIISKDCFYCGDSNKIGIDRVDNTIGYIYENCVPCCEICNRMKLNYTKELFLSHIEKIYNNQLLIKK